MEIVDCSKLALKKVKIEGNIVGKFGVFEIEQKFLNNTSDVLEVTYTFPIVETATIIGFEVNVGDKLLKGVCKDKETAMKEYQENIVKGNSAYLMEEKTNNIFQMSIGKIDKNEEVIVRVKYIDKFEIVDNNIKVVIPTLVTPRYNSNVTAPLSYGKIDYTVDFNINVNKNVNRRSITCPSHQIKITDEKDLEKITVEDYNLCKDFILYIEMKNELTSNAVISKTKDNKSILYLSFMPEIEDKYEDSEKEYIFIVDVSGSMMGKKLEETKKAVIECLKHLDEGDKFNILPFETSFTAFSLNSVTYNAESLEKAIKYVTDLRPLGGTEILAPIKFALYERNVAKTILLFTDGQVGNESEIIQYIKENVNNSRIFPFGIDTNVNSYFIKQVAKAGRGKAELIQPNEKIDDKIIRTFSRIQTPLLESLEIDYGKNVIEDEIKEDNSLFNYEFFNVFAKIEKLEDDIKLKGKILDKEYVWKITKESIEESTIDLEVVYAKMQIERLEEYIVNERDYTKQKGFENMIIELSKQYNINSKYTSFITVNERENKIYDVPKYQDTILDDSDFEYDYCCAAPIIGARMSSNDLDIPSFLRKSKVKMGEYEKDKTLIEKVDKYYIEFINKDEKDILTYLLYALYCLKMRNKIFDFNKFLEFLEGKEDVIKSNDIYMDLIYLCYNRILDDVSRSKMLGLLNDKYRKIVYTNIKFDIKVNLKLESEKEINKIIKKDAIKENINDILWYLYNN